MKPRRFHTALAASILISISFPAAHAAEVNAFAAGGLTAGATWSDSEPSAAGNACTMASFSGASPSSGKFFGRINASQP